MGTRAALLIETQDCAKTSRDRTDHIPDFREIEEFLQDPSGGDYALKILKNLNLTTIKSAIEIFFRDRKPDDTLLLFFNGYGMIDSDDQDTPSLDLYPNHWAEYNQSFDQSKALSTLFIKHHLDLCASQQIIIIFDCFTSPDLINQLRQDQITTIQRLASNDRVILASFQAPTEGRSSFCQYLIEGLQTAQYSTEIWITGQQLCHYINQRFNDEMDGVRHFTFSCDQAHDHIFVAKKTQLTPQLEYRKEVDRIFRELDQELYLEFDGIIKDPLDLGSLETYRDRCELNREEAQRIEKQVQKTYLKQAKKRQEYAKYIKIIAQSKTPLTARTWRRISEIRRNLDLGDYDTKRIEARFGLYQPTDLALNPQNSLQTHHPQQQTQVSERQSILLNTTEIPHIRYEALEEYLKAEEWKAADYETYRLMIEQMGKEEGEWFQIQELLAYPCQDLIQIDQRWVRYSHGKFGFSVQLQLWQDHNCPKSYNEAWKKFGDHVGWRAQGKWLSYQSSTPSLESSRGHLPMGGFTSDCVLWDAAYQSWGWTFNEIFHVSLFFYVSSLMTRFSTCSVSKADVLAINT